MARVYVAVPEISRWSMWGSGPQGLGMVRNKSFDGDNMAFLARSQNTTGNAPFDFPIGPSQDSGGTTFTYDSVYYFFRFKIDRLPSARTSLVDFYYRTTVAIEFHLDLNTDGSISAYNDAGAANLVATSAVQSLGTWITVYGRLLGSRTTNNVGGFSMNVNGTSVYNNFTPGSLAGAGVGLNALAALPIYRAMLNMGIATNVGCETTLDQFLLDDTDPITTASRFTHVFVTANGTFNAWTDQGGTNTTNWKWRNQRVSQMVDSGISFPYCQSVVNGDEHSWTTQTLTAAGITTGVKTAIIVHNNMNATNARHFYTRNAGAQQYETSVSPTVNTTDWSYSLQDASAWGLTDTIEIGVRCLGGVGRCGFCGLWIEHTTPFVAPSSEEDIVCQRVNYTGNGAGATGALEVTLPFEPSFLMICARTGASIFPHFWSKGMGWIQAFNDFPRRANYIYKDKLILGDNNINVNTTVYDVLCINDFAQRMIGWQNSYQVNQTVPFDTDNEQQNTVIQNPTAIWSMMSNVTFADCGLYLMGPDQASDAALQFDPAAALVSNVISALNATGFVYRRGRYVTASGGQYSTVVFKPGAFATTRLYDVFTYTGDGTANRTVPLVNLPDKTPVWVIVFPHNNSARYMRTNQMAFATPFDGSATNATAIANFAVGSFTVNGTTNTNAILYTAFVFVEGTDSAAANQYSGIYYLDPAARHDTLWDRTGAPVTTNVKIPNPIYRTHFVGDG